MVNGAQTVSAIQRAYTSDPKTAERGRVMVRVISLADCPADFGDQVTVSTNTQNPIEDRDFKSRAPEQLDLRDDFARMLSLSYVIKRGEPAPDRDHGCSITEAAEGLAAIHPNAEYSALAKRDNGSALWRDDVYPEIFSSAPNVYRVWRSVELLRVVRDDLMARREGLLSRAAAMAGYGDLLITHVVFRQLDTKAVDDPDANWDQQLAKVPTLVEAALAWSLKAVDAEYGPNSQIFTAVRNTERIERVAQSAIRGMGGGNPAPELNSDYQVPTERTGRQVAAVKTLITAGTIPDGTVLEFRPMTRPERRDMRDWLAEDPQRSRAIWRNHPKKPLQWQADRNWYSPSGLVGIMRKQASGKEVSVQGTLHWYVPEQGSLRDIAENVRAEQGLIVGDESEGLDHA